ncbi:hypothetical protein [Nocardioides sp.]|uniref:hypothetical protein n=1 Tax=Nocardioides sp. TaxID=35761 RepID=UPI0026233335|nr:hypothetical protein [Nocardioides sp.]
MSNGPSGKDRISKAEISKDAVQSTVEATAGAVGEVTTILTNAVKDVAGAIGGLATEVFEIRDAAKRAAAEQGPAEIDGDAGEEPAQSQA